MMSFEQSPPPFPTEPYPTPTVLGLLSHCWSPPPYLLVSVDVQMEESRTGWGHGSHPVLNSDSRPLFVICGLC